MIDIHSHILPLVDDGAKDMDMAIDIARVYIENGIKKVICTPHYIDGANNTSLEEVKIRMEELKKELVREGIPLDIYLGNEIYISPNIIDLIRGDKVLTLNDSRYVLIELPMNDIPLYVNDLIYELLKKDYVPIIAHPERNESIIENPNILYNYITKGALAHLNLPSLVGFYGARSKNTAELLLTHNLIHFVGTDSHSNGKRSPRVERHLRILERIVGEDYNRLTYENAMLILDNKPITTNEPNKINNRKHLFKGLATLFARL